MQLDQIKRREFITLLGGAMAWPVAARGQQRMRRIGVLMGLAEDDPEGRSRLAALARALQDLGWIEGHNIRTDYRWAAGDIERTHILATELVRSAPDAIVVNTPPGLSALQGKTHTIPIVFVQVLDASESAIVINPVRPKANVTGFTNLRIRGKRQMAKPTQRDRTVSAARYGHAKPEPSKLGWLPALNRCSCASNRRATGRCPHLYPGRY